MAQSSSEGTLRKDLGLVVLALLVVTAVSLGFGGIGTLFGLVWLLGSVGVTLALLYLLYRLVLAVERIAGAQERRARTAEVDTDATAPDQETARDARLDEFESGDEPDSNHESSDG